jgi:hypothetical protein
MHLLVAPPPPKATLMGQGIIIFFLPIKDDSKKPKQTISV